MVTLAGTTKNGYQVVLGMLKHINKDTGDGYDLDHYNSLRGQDKLEFALQLKVDRTAACMTATEHHGMVVTQSSLSVEGRATQSQVELE